MILDKLLQFDPAGTAITVTADSTNIIDMSAVRDLAIAQTGGGRWEAVITIGASLVGNAGTFQVLVRSSADNATYVTLVQTVAFAIAQLTVGTVIRVPLPSYAANPNALLPRYFKLNYVVGAGPFTGGTIESDLVYDAQAHNPATYPAGVTVAN